MHQVIIVLNNSQTNIALSFKDKDAAEASRAALSAAYAAKQETVSLSDDYGHGGFLVTSSISSVVVADIFQENEMNIEKEIYRHRAQTKLNRKLQSDPTLKIAGGLN